ncbi:Holliday junction branch migration protein RuvA [Candidatus Hydrogenosomobacter endosymbioticus]|uniref:Holliday junction branch migration complex subunit RuvA n=1 Tax=Candidatus Hydrogenosomobacter endosymbioticus TaxID=2558174 RepID=A0ABM7V8D9_9PROT|nr:Holliday junction branch migration protein RuvA [Candidatus Hydrogenosomobacter endosymbioticus]BDB96039.1 Holliday junction ATP-dependent DNA helicase RuvA [Candidatus Hydrogenosomobacter endosymbioticus]
MIAFLTGIVAYVREDCVILNVGGVGYKVFLNERDLGYVAEICAGTPSVQLNLFIESVAREEGTVLVGFINDDEQEWFRYLTQVSGVGVRMALSVISKFCVTVLCDAIIREKKTILQKADGIGSRLAARIIVDLKDRAEKWMSSRGLESGQHSMDGTIEQCNVQTGDSVYLDSLCIIEQEANQALKSLGYSQKDIDSVIARIKEAGDEYRSTEELVILCLKYVGAA